MHQGNCDFLDYLSREYFGFEGARVLEIGSRDINGSVRPWFEAAKTYIGIDREDGPGVNIVCDFADPNLDQTSMEHFDIVVCFSVLEHEPRWRSLLDNAVGALKPRGLLFLSFGTDGNKHHAPEPWAAVPLRDFLDWCVTRGRDVEIVEAFHERERFTPDCEGCYDAVLRKRATT